MAGHRPLGWRKLKPAWRAPSGFAAIPAAALDPALCPASPAVPALVGSGSAAHITLATALGLQTMAPLTAGDTVELRGYFRIADGYFAADHTSFWGYKIG